MEFYECPQCKNGKIIPSNKNARMFECPDCGWSNYSEQKLKKRSNWWYLLPIFFGIIGGVIAYFALRKDDRQKAKKCLYLGLILLTIGIITDIILVGFAPIPDAWYGVNI